MDGRLISRVINHIPYSLFCQEKKTFILNERLQIMETIQLPCRGPQQVN